MDQYWAFNSEKDLQRVFDTVRAFEAQKRLRENTKGNVSQAGIFVKITELVADSDDKEAKATEVIWNAITKAYEAPEKDPIIYDSDLLDSAGATVFNTSNITANSAMAVNDIKMIISYPNASETSDWLVVETGGGGSPIITLRINTKINGTNYGCDIVDNRRDKNITTPYDPNKKNILWLDNEPAWDLQTGDYYSAVLIEGANGSINATYQTVGSIFLRN